MKNIKLLGRTKIELFDDLTGKLKERVEEKNMVTNAVNKLFNAALSSGYAIGACGVNNPYRNDVIDTLFGGIVLFDNTITENANNLYAPSGVNTKACGATDNLTLYTDIPELGVYVPAESTSSAHARSWVYEFGTTQGNGTHACVCLTHKNAGWGGYGLNSKGKNFDGRSKVLYLSNIVSHSTLGMKNRQSRPANYGIVGSEYADICIDFDNKEKYMFCVYANRVHVIKHKIYPVNMSVFRPLNEYQSYTTVAEVNATFTGSYFWSCYNTDEKKVYFFTNNSNSTAISNSISVTVYSIDITTGTLATVGTWSSTTNKYIYIQDFMVNNGKLYFMCEDGTVYVYNFSAGTTTALTIPTGLVKGNNEMDAYILNGLIYIAKGWGADSVTRYRDVIIDTSDDSTRCSINAFTYNFVYASGQTNVSGRIIPPYDKSQIMFGTEMKNNYFIGYGSDISGDNSVTRVNTFAVTNYLATINNLSSPVTKTASQSMKVTYSLEEVEE